MEYNAEKKAFLCVRCGPNKNQWKHIYTSVLVNEGTGDVFCIVHHFNKIGTVDMVPEWKNNK